MDEQQYRMWYNCLRPEKKAFLQKYKFKPCVSDGVLLADIGYYRKAITMSIATWDDKDIALYCDFCILRDFKQADLDDLQKGFNKAKEMEKEWLDICQH